MKKLLNNYLFNLLIIMTLTFFGLWFALYDSYKQVLATVIAMPMWRIGVIVFWGLAPQLVYGLILTLMAKSLHQRYPYRHGLMNGLIGTFVSGITPSSTGGQFAQTYAFKKQGLTATQGAGLIWMDFYIYQIVLVLETLILFLWKMADFPNASITLAFALALLFNVIVIVVLWIMVEFPKLYHFIFSWAITMLGKMRFIKNKEKIVDSWNEQMIHFHDAVGAVAGNKQLFWKISGLYALRFTIYFTTPFVVAQLLGLDVKFNQFIDFLALASFVTMANTFVPLPGSSGATEGLFVLVFSTVIGKSGAASMMIFWRFATFYVPLLTGGYLFMRLKRSRRFPTLQETTKDPN